MEISEVRNGCCRPIERAKLQVGGARARATTKRPAAVRAIAPTPSSCRWVRQLAQVLRAENHLFNVFTPSGSVRLMSERNAGRFHRAVSGHQRRRSRGSSAGRGCSRGSRVLESEEALGAPGALSEEDVVFGVSLLKERSKRPFSGEARIDRRGFSRAYAVSQPLDERRVDALTLERREKPGRSLDRTVGFARVDDTALHAGRRGASLSGIIPYRRPPSIAIGSCDVFAFGDDARHGRRVQQHLARGDAGRRRSFRSRTCTTTPRRSVGQRQLHLRDGISGAIEIDDAIDRAGGGVRREAGRSRDAPTPRRLRGRRSSTPPVRRSSMTRTSGSSRSAARAAASSSSSPPRTSRWLMNELLRSWTMLTSRSIVITWSRRVLVDQIDERRQQRALAARARTGDEHEAFRLDRQRLHRARQAELIDRHRCASASAGRRRPARGDRGNSCSGRGRRRR